MPILRFNVHSNYDEVVRLRREIEALEATLKGFGPGAMESSIKSIEERLAKAREQFSALAGEAARSGEAVEKELRAASQKAQAAAPAVKFKADASQFRKANAAMLGDIDDSLQKLQSYAGQMSGLFNRFAGFTGLSVAGMGLMEFAGQVKRVRGEFQQYEVAFETMLGSAEKAKTLMGELVQTAAITPFDLSGVTNGAKQLLAYGISAKDVNQKLIQLGDIAAGLGLRLGDLVYLYGTTITQGRMFTQDLRQFQGRGIPIAKELAKQFGVAESEVGNLVTTGKVTAKEFTKAIESMAGAGGQFGGLMKKQSQTISGQISNIEDAIDTMFNEIGQSSEGAINLALQGAGKLVENWKQVGAVLGTVVAAYSGFKIGDLINEKVFDLQYKETMDKLKELQRTAEDFKLDDDIKAALDKGKISSSEAVDYQNARKDLKAANADSKTLKQLEDEAAKRIEVAKAMEEERKKLEELNDEYSKGKPQVQGAKLDDDLAKKVEEGTATREGAEELQNARDQLKEIANERQKSADAAGKEADEYRELTKMYEDDLETAKERKQKADELVESLQEQMDLQKEGKGNNDELVDELDLEAAKREQAAAQTAVETAEEQANASSKLAEAAADRQAALAEESQTISKRAGAAATTADTAATGANTAATTANTTATASNTVATKLGAMWDKTAATTKLILNNAVKATTASIKAMWAAFVANPLGAVIAAATTVIGLFMTFRSEAEETSAEVTRFGEAAVKTKNNLDTLYAVLEAAPKGSKTYQDALTQLEKIAKEYGFTLKDEKDRYEELIGLRERMTELILEEGKARTAANNIAKFQEERDSYTDEFRKDMSDMVKDENKDQRITQDATASLLAGAMIDQINAQRGEIEALIAHKKELDQQLRNQVAQNGWDGIAHSIEDEIARIQTEVVSKANETARKTAEAMDVGDYQLDIGDAYVKIEKYVGKLGDSEEALKKYTQVQKEANEAAANSRPEEAIDYTKQSVNDLGLSLKTATAALDELGKKKAAPKADASQVDGVASSAKEAKKAVDAANDAKAEPQADTAEIDSLTTSAEEAKTAVDAAGDAKAEPQADTTEIDSLTEAADTAKSSLDNAGKTVVKPKMDVSFFKKAYDWIKDMLSKIGIDLPELEEEPEEAAAPQPAPPAPAPAPAAPVKPAPVKPQAEPTPPPAEPAAPAEATADEEAVLKAKIAEQKADFDRRIKEAKSKTALSTLRKDVSSLMSEAEIGSDLYKYYKGLLKRIDAKDPDKKGDDPKKRAYEVAKAAEQEKKRIAELEAKVEQDAADLVIASMDEGTEKEIAEIHNNAKKKRDALEKEVRDEAERLKEYDRQQWVKAGAPEEKREAYKWKQTKSDDEYLAQARSLKGYEGKLAEIAFKESSDLEKAYGEELTAMRNHLKEYGTFKQRQLAIEQEYARKMAQAKTEGERLALEAGKKKDLDGVEAQAIKARIDWYSVFDNVGIVMRGQLEPLYKQLQSYVQTDFFRESGAENQKAVIEAMQNLRQQLGMGSSSWTELASSLTSYQKALDELRLATEEDTRVTAEMDLRMQKENAAKLALENARKNLAQGNGSQAQVDAAQAAYEQACQAVQDFGAATAASAESVQNAEKNVTSAGMLLQQSAISVTQPVSELTTFLQNSGIPRLGELFAAFDRLKGGVDGLKAISKAAKDAKDGIANAGEDMGKLGEVMQSEGAKTIAQTLGKGGLIAQIISAVLSILDVLKEGIGPLISSIIDSVLNAISGIIGNILSGDLFKQIGMSVANGIIGIVKSITTMGGLFDWWGGGDSDKTLEKDVERLTLTNEELRKAIQNLTEEMRDASIGGIKQKYDEAREKYAASTSNTQEMMSREGAAYKTGVLGIGGKHSSNKAIDDAMSSKEWSRVSAIVGRSVGGAADFWNLTSEQMAKVAKDAPDLYAKIKQYADDGYKNAAQYMDEYVGYYEELEQLRESYYEALTNVSLDSVKDEFKSLLGDMESTAEDFAESFEKMMRQAVINAFVNEIFSSQIEKWYGDFVKAMESDNGLSAYEQSQLQAQWDAMVESALEQRDELAKAMGWDDSVAQQSSSRAISSMSQDTGDAIEGRLTAMQITTEAIRACEQTGALSLAQISDTTLRLLSGSNAMAQHYEGVEQQIAKCYIELMAIVENTGAIIKPIQEMRGYLNEMNKKL